MNLFARIRIFALALALSASAALPAASAPLYSFRRLDIGDGLRSNTVRSMLQDRDGLIWIGTGAGLCSYDGLSFRHYPVNDSYQSFYLNYIIALAEDSDGTIWAGTDFGLYFRSLSLPDELQRLSAETSDGVGITSNVTKLAVDREGKVWVATRSQGVFRYDTRSGSLQRYIVDGTQNIESVMVDSNNMVFVCAPELDQSVYVYSRTSDEFVPFSLVFAGNSDDRVMTMAEDMSGSIWFGTWANGIWRYDKPSKKAVHVLGPEGVRHVHSIMELSPGEMLAGSDDGLLWFSPHTGESSLFVNNRFDPSSLSNKFVYPILKDREGGLWVGTYYAGVNYMSPHSGRFEKHSMSVLTGSPESCLVSCFCEDGDGNVWIGSTNCGLMCYSPAEDRALRYYTPYHDLQERSTYNVNSICITGVRLWVGTYADGLSSFDLGGGPARKYPVESVYSVCDVGGGEIWIGTTSSVMRHEPSDDSFRKMFVLGETVLDIEPSPSGEIWVATAGKGLYRYSPMMGVWTSFVHDSNDDNSLTCNYVNSLYADPSGDLWIATKEGLCVFRAREREFERIDICEEGEIRFVMGDGVRIWLSCNHGLLSYSPSDGSVRSYGQDDGIVGGTFMPNSGMISSDGKIYIGSTSGFSSFYPHNIVSNSYVPPVKITSFTAGGIQHGFGKPLRLAHSQRNIEISYAALSYCSPEKNAYRYRLEGFDRQWTDAGNSSRASYTNLPGGRYRFVVQASNNDGVWNDSGASVEFRVRPSALASPVAIVLYVILIMAVVLFVLRHGRKVYEKEYNDRFDRAIQTRDEQDMAAKIQFVTMIAHEVRTPLSLIAAPLENIRSRREPLSEKTTEDLEAIAKNSRRLITLINQLLDFSRISAAGGMKVEFAHADVVDIVKSTCERYMPSFEKNSIEFNFYSPQDSLIAAVDPEAFTKLVSNLISNAVKYTRDSVSVSLSVDHTSRTFSLIVSDNGRGLSSSEKKRIFSPFYRVDENKMGTGIGLVIVKQIVEAHSGSIIVNSTEGAGTEFMVTLPLHQENVSEAATQDSAGVALDGKDAPSAGQSEVRRDAPSGEPHLLIVEDDPDMLRFLASDFSSDYKVLTAPDGDAAKEILCTASISLIISDWMMPGTDGAALCRFVRSEPRLCDIPFVLLTARADDSSVLESLDCGADAHVKKPFSPEHLHALVAHLVRMRGMLSRKYSAGAAAPAQPSGEPAGDRDLMTRVTEIVAANISNADLSVEMLCRELCMSRSALFTKVKSASGTTPNNIILEQRLKAGAALLSGGKYSISEISYMVGFNSPSYFSKCFQKQHGFTPHGWQEKNRQ